MMSCLRGYRHISVYVNVLGDYTPVKRKVSVVSEEVSAKLLVAACACEEMQRLSD